MGREDWTGLEGKREEYWWNGMNGNGGEEEMMLVGMRERLWQEGVWEGVALQRRGRKGLYN